MKLAILILLTVGLTGVRAADHTVKPDSHQSPAHSSAPAPKGVKTVGVSEFEKLRGGTNTVVLDVRTPREYAAGHVPNAVNIDVNSPDFDKKVAALDKSKTYLVHCAAGGRGAKACGKLGQMDFGRVYNLEGGMKAWEKAGHKPVR